jgi:hypothetical protein
MKAFIIFRDRVSYGRRCADAMRRAGLDPVIVDHGSTWPAALAWLTGLEQWGIEVLYRGGGHPRHLWEWTPFLESRGSDRYVVTDPDVIPSPKCPLDWPQRLSGLLDEYPGSAKAGLGLRIDNLPEHYSRRQQVIEWEKHFWDDELEPGVFRAPLDTTLALYRERSRFELDGLRTGNPYVADHLAWHEDFSALPAETAYYYQNAERGISHWAVRGVSAWGD